MARRPEAIAVRIANLEMLTRVYGTSAEDAMHRAVVERLRCCGFATYRLSAGGGVFLVDLPLPAGPRSVRDRLLEHLRCAIEGPPVEWGEHRLYLQARLDFFSLPEGETQRAADASSSSAQAGDVRADLLQASLLWGALRQGGLALAFQPVVCPDGSTLYHEALLRSAGAVPDSTLKVPQVVTALERIGAAARLDQSVVWTCVQLLESHPDQRLGCNVSATSLHDAAWWRLLLAYLAGRPQVACRLVLEITETSTLTDTVAAFALVAQLRASGVLVAIDDMGAGYSTLAFLARSHADMVKMDRSLLMHAMDSGHPPDMLRKLVAACAVLCPCVVVEGIETEEELQAVQHSGAQGMQGFLIQTPDLHPPWLQQAFAIVSDGYAGTMRDDAAPVSPPLKPCAPPA